jgi:5-hydroxyisourate hydrolase-like protein (transthyretin family)
MNLNKKIIFISITLIIILSSLILSSFAIEEKDHINQALKFIDEEKYNEAVGELEETLTLIRNKANLELANLFFCEELPQMFGIYKPRENTLFSSEDTLFIYGEPKNCTYKEIQKGLYQMHFKVEIYLLDSNDNILIGEMNYLDFPFTSHARNSEIYIFDEIPVKQFDLSPGDYKFRFILKDVFSQKTTEAIIEFTVTE